MSEKVCPSCGKTGKAGMKYCMYCGEKLEEKDEWFSEEKPEETQLESFHEASEEISGKEEIPEDIKYQLELRTKLEELIGERSELTREIDRMMEGLSGDISIEEYKNRIKNLKNRVAELKKEEKDIEKLIKPLPLEKTSKEKEELKARLDKLKEVYRSKEISNETFEKLRKEYEKELEEVKKRHRIEKDRVESWIAQLEKERKNIQETLELLYARHKTGELSEGEYQKKKEELEKTLNRTQISLENLKIEVRQWG
ncbi:MAG: CdvA-like protein [Candidatus Freyarchaeota archaeon]